jgi:uncharacterized membrane protein HdeD (DUF308 family)
MNHRDPQNDLIEDVSASQRNTLWPDAMVNSSSVDELLWKGSPKATKVQRIGIAIFGLTFALLGVIFELIASEKHVLLPAFFGLPWLAFGIKLFINAFKRNPSPIKAKKY